MSLELEPKTRNDNEIVLLDNEFHNEPDVYTFMTLPLEIRSKIFTYLTKRNLRTLRLVCNQLRLECEVFGKFSVKMSEEHSHLKEITIPFPHLYLLDIDTDTFEIPWGDCYNDTVQRVLLKHLTFTTFLQIGKLDSIEDATLTSGVFKRSIPPLNWTCLKSLQIVFHVPQHAIETFMLENLDTLLQQQFDTLQNFRISLLNPYIYNLHSAYSVRVARFVAKHWKSLKSLEMELQGERCTEANFEQEDTIEFISNFYNIPYYRPPLHSSKLTSQEKENFLKVRLQNLEMRVTEVSCPRCAIWQEFLQQQTKLKCFLLNIVDTGNLPCNFFCNKSMTCQFQDLLVLSLNFWGIHSSYCSFDFQNFACSKELGYFEVVRHHGSSRQVTRSELLNMEMIPESLHTIVLDGFIMTSNQITFLLQKLINLKYISLLHSGKGLDIGLNSNHCSVFKTMNELQSFLVDFNPENDATTCEESISLLNSKISAELLPDEWVWKHFGQTEVNEDYHRFLFSRDRPNDDVYKGFNLYEALTEPPPKHYNELERAFFYTMKELVLTSRFNGLLFDIATVKANAGIPYSIFHR